MIFTLVYMACSFQVHAAGLKKMSRGREGSGWEWTASVRPLTPQQLCKGQINSSDPRIPSLSAINKDAPAVTCLLASCFFGSCVSDLWCNMSLWLFWKRLMGHLWHISTWVIVHHQRYGVEYGRFYVHWLFILVTTCFNLSECGKNEYLWSFNAAHFEQEAHVT